MFNRVVRRIPKPFIARRQSVTENCECIWPHKETTLEKNITDDIYRKKYINRLTKQRLEEGFRFVNIMKKMIWLNFISRFLIDYSYQIYYVIYFYAYFCIFLLLQGERSLLILTLTFCRWPILVFTPQTDIRLRFAHRLTLMSICCSQI